MLTSGDTCVTLFLQGILDVEAFNLSVRSRTDNTPYVVLLDPEGCTSSKLPARLDVKKIDSQEHSVVMCMCECKFNYVFRLRFLSGLCRPTSLLYIKQFLMFCAQGFLL